MAKNANLHKAKDAKKDEFYTQLSDIEKELKHYKKHFEGKVFFCNCDDPEHSNFWQYFSLNFDELRLKKLIATHYDREKPSYKLEMWRDASGVHSGIKTLTQNGDFRSSESIGLLKEADIVVTNPPFSLFREYVAQLMEYDKKFIIMGSINAVTYKEFFPLIKDNKVWAGFSFNKTMEFVMPDDYVLKGKAFVDSNGKKHGFVPAIAWFTNIDIKKRHEDLQLFRRYYDDPSLYPKYDNYDAIDVSKVTDIPVDYMGIMGVPVTFLDKYNPEQFEIIGCADYTGKYGSDELGVTRIGEDWMKKYRKQGGKGHYTANMTSLVYYDKCGNACNTFKRMLIKRKEKSENEN